MTGDWIDGQLEFDVPADATPDELPTSVSFSVASAADPKASAVQFSLEDMSSDLTNCVVDPSGASGSCDWTDAAPGQSETIGLEETAVDSSIGVQHLTLSEQTPGGTVAVGAQDINVIDSVVSGSATVSSHTVAIGDTVTVTATFTIDPGTPDDYLPSFVQFMTATDEASVASSLTYKLLSFSGASSCQVSPDTKGIGCQLDDPQPGDTITVTGEATATLTQLGDSGPNPFGVHHVYLGYGGPGLPAIPQEQSDQDITVVPAASNPGVGSGTGGSSASPSSGAVTAGQASAADPASGELAATGTDAWPSVAGGGILLLCGAVVLALRSRRSRA